MPVRARRQETPQARAARIVTAPPEPTTLRARSGGAGQNNELHLASHASRGAFLQSVRQPREAHRRRRPRARRRACATTTTRTIARRASSRSKTPSTRADRITHETVQLLHTTFVTPFDRDDIHRLISRMDDVLDLIQDTGRIAGALRHPEGHARSDAARRAGAALCRARAVGGGPHGLDGRRARDPQDLPGDRQARIRSRQGHARRRSPSCSATRPTCAS